MTARDKLLDALRDAGKQVIDRGDRVTAQCPAHADKNPSLSINPRRDGKGVVAYCHAGCPIDEVVAAVGLSTHDLFDDDAMRDAYAGSRDYSYPGGRINSRRPKPGGGKRFTQTNGGSRDKSLYLGDKLGDDPDATVFLNEGEKAADAMRAAYGVIAVAAGGATRSVDTSCLANRNVVIIEDNDEEGRRWAARMTERVAPTAKSVKVVRSAVDQPKADAADHIAAGKTLDEFIGQSEPTTWEPIDLGPYLRGEVERPKPSIGLARSDGQRFIYPGREHAVIGETESGKTWWAIGSVAVELRLGHRVIYIHYEESDPGSTIERLRLVGVPDRDIQELLTFVAPARAVNREWLQPLLNPPPSLVVHDGVNEAMTLHDAEIKDVGGAAEFKRRLVRPFLAVGAASLACDHLPLGADGSRRDAYGTVHKGAALDGARILLENVEPFGRGMRGRSNVFVTKDRPGHLRAQGKPSKTPGKTFMGTLIVDDTGVPDFIEFYAPKDEESVPESVTSAELSDIIYDVIHAQPDHTVESWRKLVACLRAAGQRFRDNSIQLCLDDLLVSNPPRLIEVPGKRGATGYQTVSTASRPSGEESECSALPRPLPISASPIGGEARKQSQTSQAGLLPEAVGSSGKQSSDVDYHHDCARRNEGAA